MTARIIRKCTYALNVSFSHLYNMITFRYFRRRKSSLVKLLLTGFAIIGVIFWIYQVKSDRYDKSSDNKLHTFAFPRSFEIHAEKHKETHKHHENIAPVLEKYFKNSSAFRNPALLHKLQSKTLGSKMTVSKKYNYNKIFSELNMPVMKVTPGLGEGGVPVHLSPKEQALADEVFNSAAFNVYLSDRISLNRSVPDPRNPKYLFIFDLLII